MVLILSDKPYLSFPALVHMGGQLCGIGLPFGSGIIFLILAHSVYKMWIIQEPNTLKLWNKLHFEEKIRGVYTVFKIFSTYICWINI